MSEERERSEYARKQIHKLEEEIVKLNRRNVNFDARLVIIEKQVCTFEQRMGRFEDLLSATGQEVRGAVRNFAIVLLTSMVTLFGVAVALMAVLR
jgi:hypothetical protein